MDDTLVKISANRRRTFETTISTIFSNSDSSEQLRNLFVIHFGNMPNTTVVTNINSEKVTKWFLENYSNDINDCFYSQYYLRAKKKHEFRDIYYLVFDDVLLHFDLYNAEIDILFRKTDNNKVRELIEGFKKFGLRKKVYKNSRIYLLVYGHNGLDTESMKILRPKLEISDNYNDDFLPVHQTILKRLSKKEDKGLVLLHGKPGTGKTSYIRYLLGKVNKKVIFLPPNMASAIADPGLMKLLIRNANSIFVIEDAENIIIDRNQKGHSPVSALLNLADGLLSDCLNIQVICSFNTDLSRVDNALMRKGRLIARYEFKELEINKAQALSDKLGFHSSIETPMILTNIYNQEEVNFSNIALRKAVGFS
jgi:hypothetical protein